QYGGVAKAPHSRGLPGQARKTGLEDPRSDPPTLPPGFRKSPLTVPDSIARKRILSKGLIKMVTIRLSRQGAKKHPQYLVVAAPARQKRDGAYLENLGHYYPKAKEPKDKLKVNLEALNKWVAKGAQISQTVGQLLKTTAK